MLCHKITGDRLLWFKFSQLHPGSSQLDELTKDLDQINCLAKRDLYQCQKLEAQFENNDKNKVIKCDQISLTQNKYSDISIQDCVICDR